MTQADVIRSLYATLNSRDLDRAAETFTDDAQFKDISTGTTYRGRKEIRSMIERWWKGVPDFKFDVTNVLGQGDTWAVEGIVRGTHKGPLEGPQGEIAPTGRRLEVPTADVVQLRHGKIQTLSCYLAGTVLLSQLGLMSTSKAA